MPLDKEKIQKAKDAAYWAASGEMVRQKVRNDGHWYSLRDILDKAFEASQLPEELEKAKAMADGFLATIKDQLLIGWELKPSEQQKTVEKVGKLRETHYPTLLSAAIQAGIGNLDDYVIWSGTNHFGQIRIRLGTLCEDRLYERDTEYHLYEEEYTEKAFKAWAVERIRDYKERNK